MSLSFISATLASIVTDFIPLSTPFASLKPIVAAFAETQFDSISIGIKPDISLLDFLNGVYGFRVKDGSSLSMDILNLGNALVRISAVHFVNWTYNAASGTTKVHEFFLRSESYSCLIAR